MSKFTQSFDEWIDNPEFGFYINDNWNIEENTDGGVGLLKLLSPWDVILKYVLVQDEQGRFPYSTVLLSAIKKSGKTVMAACVTAWYAECAPAGSEIFICANSEEQSVRLIFKDLKFHFEQRGGIRVLKDRIILPNGTLIQVLTRNYTSNAGGRHALVVFDELWGACVDQETECYTKIGWKKYDEVKIGEEIATINPDTLMFEWNPTQDISIFDYDGEMYKFNHRRGDMLVTPNHKILGKFRPSGNISLNDPLLKYEFRAAEDAASTFEGRISIQAGWQGNRLDTFTVPGCYVTQSGNNRPLKYMPSEQYPAGAFLEFMGYYLSEGCVAGGRARSNNPSALFIAQLNSAHPEVVLAMKECFDILGFDYVHNKKGFYIKEKLIAMYVKDFGHAHQKYVADIIKDYDAEYLVAFFDAFISGDGWECGSGFQTELSSKQLVEDLMEISIKIGYTPRYMGNRMRSHIDKRDGRVIANKYPAHRASFSTGNLCYHRKNWSVEQYKGKVWCPTTENQTWLARRNGNIYWTGNTSTADYRRFDEMTPIPTIPHSLQLITSYAGFYGESNLLHDVYLRSVDDDEANGEGGQGTLIPELAPLPCYENGDAYFAYWDHEPRMPWQTQKYYDKQLQTLRPSAYIRLHENRWVTSNETFIPMEWWKTAVNNFTQVCHNIQEMADRPISDPQQADLWRSHPYVDNPLYLAIDTGMKHDCTAIIGVTTDAELGKVIMMVHKIWTPIEGEILDLESTIEPYIKELSGLFNIVDITCDPSQMLQLMTKFRGMGLPVSEFTQSEGGMISASQNLYDLLHDKNLWAYESAELETHLKNSIAQHTSRGFRIVKDKSNRRIARKKVDAAIALAMAAYKAVLDIDFTGGEVIRIEDPFSSRQAVPRPADFDELKIPWELRD